MASFDQIPPFNVIRAKLPLVPQLHYRIKWDGSTLFMGWERTRRRFRPWPLPETRFQLVHTLTNYDAPEPDCYKAYARAMWWVPNFFGLKTDATNLFLNTPFHYEGNLRQLYQPFFEIQGFKLGFTNPKNIDENLMAVMPKEIREWQEKENAINFPFTVHSDSTLTEDQYVQIRRKYDFNKLLDDPFMLVTPGFLIPARVRSFFRKYALQQPGVTNDLLDELLEDPIKKYWGTAKDYTAYRAYKKQKHFTFEEDATDGGYITDYEKDLKVLKTGRGVFVGGGWFFQGQGNILTIGGSRSGKGVNQILPHLLSKGRADASMVIVDVKGELSAISYDWQRKLGRTVHIVDPWGILARLGSPAQQLTSSLNPLEMLQHSGDDLPDDCDMFAEMLLPYSKMGDNHFDSKARQWLSAYLLHLATSRPSVTLSDLRSILRQDKEGLLNTLSAMLENPAFGGIVRDAGNEMLGSWETGAKEAQSILSTAQRATDIFKSPAMQKSLQSSGFDLPAIPAGGKVVYLVIPAERVSTHSVWLRLILGAVLTTVQRYANKEVVLLMDEFYSLGYFKTIDQNMGLMPSYNLKLWPVLQDLNQLRRNYGESWETFVSNSTVMSFFPTQNMDNFTADYLSKIMGSSMAMVMPRGGTGLRQMETPLFSASDLRKMGGWFLSIVRGEKAPILFDTKPYYRSSHFSKRAKPNPYL